MQLLTLWFGANDACLAPSPQHVPLAAFAAHLDALVATATATAATVGGAPWPRVVLLTPPPVNTHQRRADLGARDPPRALDRAFDATAQYAQAVRDAGRRHGLPVVDVWAVLWEACGRDEARLDRFLTDGLHVNEEAHAVRRAFS